MKKELYILLAILITKSMAMIALINSGPIGLGPDEAQYWTWAKNIDWGYYSKPPGIAWEIWLGTFLLGNNPLGVRIMPVIIGFLLPLILYRAARNCDISPRNAMYAAVAFALAPLGLLSSLFAITDGGMLLFWTAALAFLLFHIHNNTTPSYLLAGLLVGCGALFKWPCYLFWPLIIAAWPLCRSLISPKILAGIAISLLALLPSIYWNISHDWATFRHVSSTVTGGHGRSDAIFAGNPLEYIGSQAAIISPILFILMLIGIISSFLRWKELPNTIRVCCLVTSVLFVGGFLLSLFMKIQGNWAIAAYPSGFIVMGWELTQRSQTYRNWMVGGMILSVALTAATIAIPTIQSHGISQSAKIPYKINPFRHNIGWENISEVLITAGYNPRTDNLVADKYQTVSILSFYGPQQKRAFFFNLSGIRKNQFSYWPEMDKKKKCYFVVFENIPQLNKQGLAEEYTKKLQEYFTTVAFLGVFPLFHSYDEVAKGALIFECLGFNGNYPKDPNLY